MAAHLAVLAAFLWPRADTPRPAAEGPPEELSLAPAPTPAPSPAPEAAPKPAAAAKAATTPRPQPVTPAPVPAPPAPVKLRTTRVRPDAPSLPAAGGAPAAPGPELTDAEIAGAATAGAGDGDGTGPGGGGGGSCDMARWLQGRLRRDGRVQAALAASNVGARAFKVWDGDWIQSAGEDGKGLAVLREAIMWDVAFAPAACRAQPVRGLVLLSAAPSGARVALGAGAWRWSDLLQPRKAE